MATFIALSSDMKDLLFRDDGGTQTISDLTTSNGVDVKISGGKLTVVSGSSSPSGKQTKISSDDYQIQVSFNPNENIFSLIGELDLDGGIKIHRQPYDLDQDIVNLKRSGADIIATIV